MNYRLPWSGDEQTSYWAPSGPGRPGEHGTRMMERPKLSGIPRSPAHAGTADLPKGADPDDHELPRIDLRGNGERWSGGIGSQRHHRAVFIAMAQ